MTALDELFMNDKERAENKLPKIFDIPLSEIDDFPDHPYCVLDDEDMQNLMESIKDRGVITPAMVRKKDDGRYEMISGHRRKHASERLGLETLRCEVVEVSRDEAIILMVDSNAQRSVILPCDKGRAFKMKLEALKRQGQRTDLTSTPAACKLKGETADIVGKQAGESGDQVRRFIRLTYLIKELQDFVDKGQMKMRPAVELSYLDEETQRDVVDRIDETEAFPSHDQAIRIRRAYENGEIDYDKVKDIMDEEKPNQKPKFTFSFDRLKPYIPKDYSDSKAEDYVMAVTGFITIVAAVLLCVCIHEFIHMLGYKLCRCNCVLVYSKPLITISVMGSEWLTKKQALFVTLLPFLVIDALSFFVFLITKNSLLLMWLLLINTALAGSDLVCVFVLAKTPKSSLTLGHYMRKQ